VASSAAEVAGPYVLQPYQPRRLLEAAGGGCGVGLPCPWGRLGQEEEN